MAYPATLNVHIEYDDQFIINEAVLKSGYKAIAIKSNVTLFIGAEQAARLIATLTAAFPLDADIGAVVQPKPNADPLP